MFAELLRDRPLSNIGNLIIEFVHQIQNLEIGGIIKAHNVDFK